MLAYTFLLLECLFAVALVSQESHRKVLKATALYLYVLVERLYDVRCAISTERISLASLTHIAPLYVYVAGAARRDQQIHGVRNTHMQMEAKEEEKTQQTKENTRHSTTEQQLVCEICADFFGRIFSVICAFCGCTRCWELVTYCAKKNVKFFKFNFSDVSAHLKHWVYWRVRTVNDARLSAILHEENEWIDNALTSVFSWDQQFY